MFLLGCLRVDRFGSGDAVCESDEVCDIIGSVTLLLGGNNCCPEEFVGEAARFDDSNKGGL